jgi:hypothetical protein
MEANFSTALIERPEVVLALIAMLAGILAAGVSSFVTIMRRKNPYSEYEQTITRILSNPAVMKNSENNPELITQAVTAALAALPRPEPRPAPAMTGILNKISSDITWDVAGLIGILVTGVILIMIISSKTVDIPDTVFAGWTTILGYYFGKAAGKHG